MSFLGCTDTNLTCPANGQQVLQSIGFGNRDHLTLNMIIMIAMIIVIRFIAYLALLIRSMRIK